MFFSLLPYNMYAWELLYMLALKPLSGDPHFILNLRFFLIIDYSTCDSLLVLFSTSCKCFRREDVLYYAAKPPILLVKTPALWPNGELQHRDTGPARWGLRPGAWGSLAGSRMGL